ncbi:MAG: nitroreductase family protein [Candidatus Heimdallarchaeota archaeon]
MNIEEIIKQRRSIRRYKPNEVSTDHIKAILEAGNNAPSAKNGQQWRFHIFTKEAKTTFADFCLTRFDEVASERGPHKYARNSFLIMTKAPVIILVLCEPMGKNVHPSRPDIQSASAAIQNMLLRAFDLGLGSLWICDILYIEQEVKDYLNTDLEIVAALTFGYSAASPKEPTKKSVEELSTWHT